MQFLLIDQDAEYRKVLKYHLQAAWPDSQIDEHEPKSPADLPPSFDISCYDAVLLGYPSESRLGLEWLVRMRRVSPGTPVIVFAEPSDEFLAVESIKAGAVDYFPKSRVTHHRLVGSVRERLDRSSPSVAPAPVQGAPLSNRAGYRFVRTLHSSDIASVYLAESERTGEQLAFKVIRYVPDSGSERLFDRFLQEYEIIGRLDHRNIVEIFDFGVADDHAFIAMEYLSGGSLAGRLNGPLAPARAVDYVRQIGGALAAIHAAGILHRDLKPANIMFRDDGSLALIDFGLAKQTALQGALTGDGQIFGTPYYMSPEQGHAEPLDERSDLYSLGCIFFEMLTGRRPFLAATAMGVIYKHAHAERPQLDDGLAAFRPVVDRLLAAAPGQRYVSAAALLEALESISC